MITVEQAVTNLKEASKSLQPKELSQKEKLQLEADIMKAEIKSLEDRIKADHEAIYWLKKRLAPLQKQIDSIPEPKTEKE
jgi:predicted RNase H-like nuclease (RuvC/YqgF family)